MGFIAMLLLIIGWILIVFSAFGSGLTLHVGSLSTLDVGIVFVLLALCIGPVVTFAGPFVRRP